MNVTNEELNANQASIQKLESSEFQDFDVVEDAYNGLKYLNDPIFYTKQQSKESKFVSVNFSTYDFGWLLKDETGKQFISYLKSLNSDSTIFELEIIQTLINCQWHLLKRQVLTCEFSPMVFYLLSVLMYNTILNSNLFSKHTFETSDPEQLKTYEYIHYAFGFITSILSIYFIVFEIRKYRESKSKLVLMMIAYNSVIMITNVLDTILFFDYSKNSYIKFFQDPLRDAFKIISTIVVLWTYVIFLVQLRIFERYAAMINMRFYVLKGSLLFLFIFFLMIWAFGNTFFIMSTLDSVENSDEYLAGPDIFMAFLFAYRTTLGDLQFEEYLKLKRYKVLFYSFFLVQTVIMMIVLLNLLVALLSEIYSQIMLLKKNEQYKVKCQIINENEYIFNRKKLFANAKYIIVAEVEKSQKHSYKNEQNIEKFINTFKNTIKTQKTDSEQIMKESLQKLEYQIQNLDKKIDSIQDNYTKNLKQ
eukprot:403343377